MQFATEARGRGLGPQFLAHVERAVVARGARRLYLAVLDGNPRARAFWGKMGFALALADMPRRLGQKDHLVSRLVKPLG
jgi:GNAT superfamily N-acetyltransferase